MHPWALVTPASRGIGRAIARRILSTTNVPVVATARKDLSSAKEEILGGLKDVDEKRLHILELDVLDESTISSASFQCRDRFPSDNHHLRLAFLVPGVLFPEKSPAQIDGDNALLTLRTNTLGPLLLLKHFAPFLPTRKTPLSEDTGLPSHAVMAFMSARVGSISDNKLGGWYSYRASKAAVNQIVKTFDNHLQTMSSDKAMAVGFHPGTVKTGLSKEFWGSVKKEKLFEPDWVAERLVGLATGKAEKLGDGLSGLGIGERGRCWDWEGTEVPP